MARKNAFIEKIESNQSLAVAFISPVTVVRFHDNLSYQINITTSDSVGSFVVQGSNDYESGGPIPGVANPGTWTDLALGGGTPNANAANDSISIDTATSFLTIAASA